MMLLSPRVLAELALVAAIAGVVWFAYSWAYDRGATAITVKWDAEKSATAKAIADMQAKARKDQQALQEKADDDRKKYQAATHAANARTDALIASLQDRPNRDGGTSVPNASGSCTGQTGASLARPDAEFLTRYAADANRLQLALQQCESAYEAARAAVNKKD